MLATNQDALNAEPRAVATGCQHSMLKAARMLYFIVDGSIRSLPLAVLQWLHFKVEFANAKWKI